MFSLRVPSAVDSVSLVLLATKCVAAELLDLALVLVLDQALVLTLVLERALVLVLEWALILVVDQAPALLVLLPSPAGSVGTATPTFVTPMLSV